MKNSVIKIWISVDRTRKIFINFIIGDRSKKTGQKLYNSINTRVLEFVATDYWKAYTNFIPPEKHIQSKAETYIVEGYNSLFRHFLARIRRKSKCYSKSEKMLEISIKLLMLKWNNQLSILN